MLAYSLSDLDKDSLVFATVPWEYTVDSLLTQCAQEAHRFKESKPPAPPTLK